MTKETQTETIDWHSGFDGLLGIGFWKYRDKIHIDREYILSKRSLKIDFVLIKKTTDVYIDNAVGRIFRKYNIIEYKNPNDALNIDVVWKVIAYAALYKCHGNHVDEIQSKDLTATIFRHRKPVKLFAQLAKDGKEVEKIEPGCYMIKGLADIVLQIVVGSELQEDDFKALKIMTQGATVEEVEDFMHETSKNNEQGYRLNAKAVLRVGAMVNKEVFKIIGEVYGRCVKRTIKG